jgi:DNA polymerase-3 subunit delta
MVAVKAPAAAGFVKSPDPRISAILLFGGDAGMVSERAAVLAKVISSRENPPGEIIRIEESDLDDDADRLAVELQTMPMFGGRKVVRTSTGRRINAQYLKPIVEAGNLAATLIVEAGNLKTDEALRTLFEKSAIAAAVACYADEARDLEGLVREVLAPLKIEIAPEAREALVARLGADRTLSRNEIEKLALYVGNKARIDVEDVEAVVGDAAELALDMVVMAAAAGDTPRALAEIDRALAAGEKAQVMIGALQRHIQRIHRLRAMLETGRSLDDAIRSLRPPVFFKAQPALKAHCQGWTLPRLDEAKTRIAAAAKAARLGGDLEQPIAERLLIEIARLARASIADQRRS